MHDEPNCNITIGDNCLFSFGILMRPSDGHTVYDLNTKKIYNRAAGGGIVIGNHVWIGMRCSILKNTFLADDIVVGACSLLNKKFILTNCVIAGIPAKIKKQNISWDVLDPTTFEKELK